MSRDARLYVLTNPLVEWIQQPVSISSIPLSTTTPQLLPFLISTHLISDIEPILDEIVFLKDGKVVRQGNVDDIRYESGESIDQLFRQEFKA